MKDLIKKPLGIPSYGGIPHMPGSRLGSGDHHISEGQVMIGTEKLRDPNDLVIVQEKLDGANVGVAKVNGEIIALQRAGYEAKSSPHNQLKLFDLWVNENKSRFEFLKENERLCGEWLIQACGTKYNLPHEPFVPFDLMMGRERSLYHDFLLRVLPQSFTVPRLIHLGGPFSLKKAIKALDDNSYHGALEEIEGVVYRIERLGKVDFLMKWVRQTKIDGKYLGIYEEFEGPVWNNFPELKRWEMHGL